MPGCGVEQASTRARVTIIRSQRECKKLKPPLTLKEVPDLAQPGVLPLVQWVV